MMVGGREGAVETSVRRSVDTEQERQELESEAAVRTPETEDALEGGN